MDFSDIFSGDTWDTINNVLQSPATKMLGLGLGALTGTQAAKNTAAAQRGAVASLDQLYGPTSPYAAQMRSELERRDAAAGRRSQYGPREAELAAKLTSLRSGQLLSPQYQALLKGGNANPYGSLLAALGYANQQRGKSGNNLVNSAQNLNNLRKGYNSLTGMFADANPDVAAASLGGAENALGEVGLGSGSPDLFSTGGGIFGSPQDFALSPFAATNEAAPLDAFSTSVGGLASNPFSFGLGGAGDFGGAALGTGIASGELGGMGTSLGAADTLGSMFGTGAYLPGYGAGASSLFGGGGAGAAASGAADAGAAGAGWASGLGGLGAVALPFGLAAGGMLGALFGMSDDGTPFTNAQDAMANAMFKNSDFASKYANGGLDAYMNSQFGGNQWTDDQYSQATKNLHEFEPGAFFSNFLGGGENAGWGN